MSGKLVGRVLEHAPEDLTPAEMLVLVSLAESARDGTRIDSYNSSVTDIARRTRLAPKTIRNALSALAQAGLIRSTNGDAHRGKVQYYELAPLDKHHRHVTIRKRPSPGTQNGDDSVPPEGR